MVIGKSYCWGKGQPYPGENGMHSSQNDLACQGQSIGLHDITQSDADLAYLAACSPSSWFCYLPFPSPKISHSQEIRLSNNASLDWSDSGSGIPHGTCKNCCNQSGQDFSHHNGSSPFIWQCYYLLRLMNKRKINCLYSHLVLSRFVYNVWQSSKIVPSFKPMFKSETLLLGIV